MPILEELEELMAGFRQKCLEFEALRARDFVLSCVAEHRSH